MQCPCGLNTYDKCCGQYIDHNILPPTPEALMRSRYSAFVLAKIDYLAETMKGNALKKFKLEGIDTWLKSISWQGLIVTKCIMRSKQHGFVSFEAHYIENGINQVISEKSEFKKLNGKWFYVDGKTLAH